VLTFCFGQGRIARNAGVAQLVEQLICNQPVGGSSPFTSFFNRGCCESILFFVKLFFCLDVCSAGYVVVSFCMCPQPQAFAVVV
jgi:hypothetical protein